MSKPRGVINFNPCNLRRSADNWLGLSPQQLDPAFFQFLSAEYGIRAGLKVLLTYEAEGVKTVRAAINRWAPPSENDTAAYIKAVCKDCGVGPDDEVSLKAMQPALIKAIISHEQGQQPYSDPTIAAALEMAGIAISAPAPSPAAPAPSAPDSVPWYKSAVIRGLLVTVISQLMARVKAHYHVDLTLAGISADDLANWALDGISALSVAYALHGRIAKPNPPVTK